MKFNIRGEIYELDDTALTFKDVRDMEKVTGILFSEQASNFIAEAGMTGLQAVVWIAMRKKDPDLKFSDTDDIPISALAEIVEEDDESAEDEESDPYEGEE